MRKCSFLVLVVLDSHFKYTAHIIINHTFTTSYEMNILLYMSSSGRSILAQHINYVYELGSNR